LNYCCFFQNKIVNVDEARVKLQVRSLVIYTVYQKVMTQIDF